MTGKYYIPSRAINLQTLIEIIDFNSEKVAQDAQKKLQCGKADYDVLLLHLVLFCI